MPLLKGTALTQTSQMAAAQKSVLPDLIFFSKKRKKNHRTNAGLKYYMDFLDIKISTIF